MISQTLFSSRKDPYPTWRFFSLRAPSTCYFGISNNWPWMGIACECLLELHTQTKSARTSVFILTKSDFQLYVQPNSLAGPLIGTTCTLLYCNVPVSCLKQIACALKSQVHNSYICLLCISGQSLPLWKFWYQPPSIWFTTVDTQ